MRPFPVEGSIFGLVLFLLKTMGLSRTFWIYTPPGYEKGKKFPVLYLIHGAGDIESGWTMIGRVNNILDNLIAHLPQVFPVVCVRVQGSGFVLQNGSELAHAPPVFCCPPTKKVL
jgi:dipeptidyl aminopeptidase/acylaminoacyl peptidase